MENNLKEEFYSHYSRREWRNIVSLYKNNENLFFENKKMILICVEAMRNIGDFQSANTLELKLRRSLARPMLEDIVDILFYTELGKNEIMGSLSDYLLKELGKEERFQWVDFFKLVSSGYDSSLVESLYESLSDLSGCIHPHRKIFISGFERSGTGALRDFLNEYEEVYEVPGSEIQVIAGRHGLSYLYSAKDENELKSRFIDFFVVNALGVSRVFDYLDHKEIGRARIIIKNSNEKLFLGAFFYFYAELFIEKINICSACQNFINRLLSSLTNQDGKEVFLFNNVINARNIWMLNLVDNYICFPVTRDPRSQFASKISTRMPNLSADNFVKTFIKTQRIYREGIKTLDSSLGQVIEVKFEDIVSSESKRLEISNLCKLDNQSARRFTKLKPEESKRNMYLHKLDQFSDFESDFLMINDLLKDYCVV